MSPLLSALTGKPVTQAELLGTDAEEKRKLAKLAERKANRMLKKMKKAGML